MTLQIDMTGRHALVTGGGRGIGRSIALSLAEAGADVAVAARTAKDLEAVAAEVEALGRNGVAIPTDLANATACAGLVEQAAEALGGLDVLVNNAALMAPWKRAEAVTAEDWDKLLAVNLRAPHLLSAAAHPHMRDDGGSIVNVASVAGTEGTRRMLPYSATKAGLIQLTRDLATEWAGHGIRVNCVAPGWVETDMTAGVRSNEDIHDALRATVPMGRFATPDEIGPLVAFLASDAASYITGGLFVADGGESV